MDAFEQEWRKTVKEQLGAMNDEMVNRLAKTIFKDDKYHTIDEIVDNMLMDEVYIASRTEPSLNA